MGIGYWLFTGKIKLDLDLLDIAFSVEYRLLINHLINHI